MGRSSYKPAGEPRAQFELAHALRPDDEYLQLPKPVETKSAQHFRDTSELAAPLAPGENFMPTLWDAPLAPGDFLQIGDERLRVSEILGHWMLVERNITGSGGVRPYAAGTKVFVYTKPPRRFPEPEGLPLCAGDRLLIGREVARVSVILGNRVKLERGYHDSPHCWAMPGQPVLVFPWHQDKAVRTNRGRRALARYFRLVPDHDE